ncbi:GtrA family protein [Duganella sp. CF458]|uniref:GtrA family protein n=1 Tax=Duganella sp. CF458 TaxID=1884368 RepID=UPI000B8922B0|nr:GtrA family protein [Duganella sp. CF458]
MNQFLVFVLVGVTCAVIDVGLMELLGRLGLHYMIAASAGFAAGLAANFALHTCLTFKARYSHATLVRFMGVVLINYLMTMLCVSLFQYWLEMPVLGKVISLPLVAGNGFLLSKHWVFK